GRVSSAYRSLLNLEALDTKRSQLGWDCNGPCCSNSLLWEHAISWLRCFTSCYWCSTIYTLRNGEIFRRLLVGFPRFCCSLGRLVLRNLSLALATHCDRYLCFRRV